MAQAWASERKQRLEGKSFAEQVTEVAKIRSEEGAWAEVEQVGDDYYITQFNCSCPKSSSRHPEVLCATELAYLRQLLGPNVERIEWAREGARACRYRVSGCGSCAAAAATNSESAEPVSRAAADG
jgi:predicted ArsR family transcriptional regulator